MRWRWTGPGLLYDLPAGGRRLMQRARGYDATIVAGTVTYRHGEATGALPGKLVRCGASMADIQRHAPPRDGRPFPPLSVAVRHGATLYVSGIGPFAPDGSLAVGDFAAQFAEVIKSLHAILAEAGTDITKVVKTNVLLTRAGDVREMNRLYAAAFPGRAPAGARHLRRRRAAGAGIPAGDRMRGRARLMRAVWSERPHRPGRRGPAVRRAPACRSRQRARCGSAPPPA